MHYHETFTIEQLEDQIAAGEALLEKMGDPRTPSLARSCFLLQTGIDGKRQLLSVLRAQEESLRAAPLRAEGRVSDVER